MIDNETLERVVEFHGHMCPGLALGIQAARIALREIGPHAKDEEVVAVVETDMCSVDAIQFLTGCTFGKGNLIHRDWGKHAYTFHRRSDGRAVRILIRPDGWQRNPEQQELFAKLRSGQATPEERARYGELHQSESRKVLDLEPEVLFEVREVSQPPPQLARIQATMVCQRCGEGAMETRIRRLDGRDLCPPCFDAALNGEEPVSAPTVVRAR